MAGIITLVVGRRRQKHKAIADPRCVRIAIERRGRCSLVHSAVLLPRKLPAPEAPRSMAYEPGPSESRCSAAAENVIPNNNRCALVEAIAYRVFIDDKFEIADFHEVGT